VQREAARRQTFAPFSVIDRSYVWMADGFDSGSPDSRFLQVRFSLGFPGLAHHRARSMGRMSPVSVMAHDRPAYP
jgi:hypothetical protein